MLGFSRPSRPCFHPFCISVEQGTKALVYDADTGEVIGRGSVGYELVSERPGQAEQAPSLWVEVRGQRWGHGWGQACGRGMGMEAGLL